MAGKKSRRTASPPVLMRTSEVLGLRGRGFRGLFGALFGLAGALFGLGGRKMRKYARKVLRT